MNLRQMILEVRRAIDEIDADFWSNSEIIDYLNEGAKVMVSEAQPLQASWQKAVTIGTREYLLPPDFDEAFDVQYYKNGMQWCLSLTTPAAATYGTKSNSTPTHFYIRKQVSDFVQQGSDASLDISAINADKPEQGRSVIGLNPPPDTAGELTVHYFPSHYTMRRSSDVSPVPVAFHRGIVAYAIAMCKAKDEAYAEMNNIFLPMFEQFTKRLKTKMINRGQQVGFNKVKVMDEDDYGRGSSVIIIPESS